MSVSLTFRCPDDLAELIQQQVETTGKDKTSVIIGMLRQSLLVSSLEESRNTMSNNMSNVVSDKDNLDALIEERMTTVLDKQITTLLDERITARVDSLVEERGLKPEIIKEQLEDATASLATKLNATISELKEQLEELRGKIYCPVALAEESATGQDKNHINSLDNLEATRDSETLRQIADRTLNKLKMGRQSSAGKAIDAFIKELQRD